MLTGMATIEVLTKRQGWDESIRTLTRVLALGCGTRSSGPAGEARQTVFLDEWDKARAECVLSQLRDAKSLNSLDANYPSFLMIEETYRRRLRQNYEGLA